MTGGEISEKELALLCTKKDKSAMKELYNRYATRLYSLCCRYTQDPETGKDLLHDTIIKAFDKIANFSYRGDGSLYAWLRKIAINLAIERIRKDVRLKDLYSTDDHYQVDDPDPESINAIPLNDLQKMISALPESKRIIFCLHCIDGISHKDISSLLGISVGTSTSTLAKAKKHLACLINDYLRKRL